MSFASPDPATTPSQPGAGGALWLAAGATLLASTCCVLPLLLVIVGLSGAWISRMHVLEPYAPALIALALGSLALAAWRLFRAPAAEACSPDDAACRVVRPAARRWFWVVAALALVPIVVPLLAPLFY